MALNNFVPVSWNGEAVTNDKLNQMANNDQYLFERTPTVRYSNTGANVVRDDAMKIMAGKAPIVVSTTDNVDVNIYFGSYFTAGTHPIVTATYEPGGTYLAKFCSVRGFAGEIDHTGCIIRVYSREAAGFTNDMSQGGWVHWQAVGF